MMLDLVLRVLTDGNAGEYTLLGRLLAHRVLDGECWVFRGATDDNGYGKICYKGKSQKAHRLMADIARISGTGPEVCHTCDNPPCFNPTHLFRGTHRQNFDDGVTRGRFNKPTKRRLSLWQAADIRIRVARGATWVSLAREYGVSHSAVQQIIQDRTYRKAMI